MGLLSAWRGKRVLVTGGTGFIGRHLLRQGADAGIELHTLSRQGALLEGIQDHQADLLDRDRVFQVVGAIRPEGIIHLAAAGVSYGGDNLNRMLQTNGVGTENLLSAASALESKPLVVIAGTGFEYAPQERPISESDPVAPTSIYGISKAVAALCAGFYAKHLSITLLRVFSVYGPGEQEPRLAPSIIARSKRGEPIELTGCEQVRDYTYVEEAAESFWRGLTSPPVSGLRTINVGTGQPVMLKHYVSKLADILLEHGCAPRLVFSAKPYRADEPMTCVPDVRLMTKELGWTPSMPIEEGLLKTVEAAL